MANTSCVFCDIYNEKAPANIFYKDEEVVIFSDIRPAAKHHYLVVPKHHLVNAKQLTKEHIPLVENLVKHGRRFLEEKQADVNDSSHNMFYKDWQKFKLSECIGQVAHQTNDQISDGIFMKEIIEAED